MRIMNALFTGAFVGTLLCGAAPIAHAQISPWPDSQSCGTTGGFPTACLKVTQTTTNNTGEVAITAQNTGDGYGIYATASGSAAVYALGTGSAVPIYADSTGTTEAVYGQSTASYGIWGQSYGSSSAAVYGQGGSSSNQTNTSGVLGVSYAGTGVVGSTANGSLSGVYGVASVSGGGGSGVIGNSSGQGIGIYGQNTSTSGWSGYFNGRVDVVLGLVVAGSCIGGSCTSDIRLKKNVQPLTGSLDELVKFRPVTFEWKNPEVSGRTEGRQLGFIAQEVEKVKPEWVGVDDRGFKTLNTNGLPIMLVDSVRTLKTENDALRARAGDLEDRVKALEAHRRPMISGVGEGGVGLGLLAVAGAMVVSRRKRSDLTG